MRNGHSVSVNFTQNCSDKSFTSMKKMLLLIKLEFLRLLSSEAQLILLNKTKQGFLFSKKKFKFLKQSKKKKGKEKLSTKELMLLNCGVGEDSWESLALQGDPTSPFWRELGKITLIANVYCILTEFLALGLVLYRGHPT